MSYANVLAVLWMRKRKRVGWTLPVHLRLFSQCRIQIIFFLSELEPMTFNDLSVFSASKVWQNYRTDVSDHFLSSSFSLFLSLSFFLSSGIFSSSTPARVFARDLKPLTKSEKSKKNQHSFCYRWLRRMSLIEKCIFVQCVASQKKMGFQLTLYR